MECWELIESARRGWQVQEGHKALDQYNIAERRQRQSAALELYAMSLSGWPDMLADMP